MAELLDMGKYAAFIWPSYGVSLMVIGGFIVWSLRRRHKARALLRQIEAVEKPAVGS